MGREGGGEVLGEKWRAAIYLTLGGCLCNTPCLHHITLCSQIPLEPRFHPLFNGGGLVNLTLASLDEGLEQLGEIYSTGGLSQLQTLELRNGWFEEQAMNTWLNGVLAFGHRGAALRGLQFPQAQVETDFHFALLQALSDGAYPDLEVLDVQPDGWDIFTGDEVGKAAFVVAMARGAPCASTLGPAWGGDSKDV